MLAHAVASGVEAFAMRPFLLLLAALLALVPALVLALAPAKASIQAPILCWEPDIEYPVPCDDDDD